MDGDKHYPIGKQVEKMTRGRHKGFHLQEDLLLGYFQRQVAQTVVKQK